MDLIADILLAGGAIAAAVYCLVLSRKLSRFSRLDQGVGGAIAVLSGQVDDLAQALQKAEGAAKHSTESLNGLTGRAEQVASRLEIMLAAMHDIPEGGGAPAPEARRMRVQRRRVSRDLIAAE